MSLQYHLLTNSSRKSNQRLQKAVDKVIKEYYHVIEDNKRGEQTVDADKLIEGIKKAGKVVKALSQLTLEIGTLIAIIKMVIESV